MDLICMRKVSQYDGSFIHIHQHLTREEIAGLVSLGYEVCDVNDCPDLRPSRKL